MNAMHILKVPLMGFVEKLSRILPKLIDFVSSPVLRRHPVWGRVIPYNVPAYGTGVSLGHCIRPDVLLTADGPKICELDFVPSGRGCLLAGLGATQQAAMLEVFSDWYREMGVSRVLYATATTTTCREETDFFTSKLHEFSGLDIQPGNIDSLWGGDLRDRFIDRLWYRSESGIPDDRKDLKGLNVSTAEPYLDSKAIFAMVHDESMTKTLEDALGKKEVDFLREVFPYTILTGGIKGEKELERITMERSEWVLKSTEVETDHSWGCRGVVSGANYSGTKFLRMLHGENVVHGKKIGVNPILQRWYSSRDFWQTWNDVIDGVHQRAEPLNSERLEDPKTFTHASKEVNARIGFYFLVVRGSRKTLVPPYGYLMLRQDRLVHGASDAIRLPVQAY